MRWPHGEIGAIDVNSKRRIQKTNDYIGGFHKWEYPIAGWFISGKIPVKWMI